VSDADLDECWVVTNGADGNERQALALASYLPWPVRTLIAEPRAPWAWFAPRRLPGARMAWGEAAQRMLKAPWPRLIIGCGRSTALFTRLVREWSDGRCRSVQILDPRIDPRHWDLVITPQHDALKGDNVLHPLGSLNPIDDAWLADARQAWESQITALPAPRLGVLLGGPRHGVALDANYAEQLIDAVLARHGGEGGSVLVLASRRTPSALFEQVERSLNRLPGLTWRGDDDGINPYPGVLAWADRLVVTPDSVNMLTEACATGRPVHTLITRPLTGKLARFHEALRARGLLHPIDAETAAQQPPLRETADIAAALCERLDMAWSRPDPGRAHTAAVKS
jgi:mitochondrial fission protein ELM1